jgi:hypothetical protein
MNEPEIVTTNSAGEFSRGYRLAIANLMDEAMGEADMDFQGHFYVPLSFLLTRAEGLIKEQLG